MRNPTDTYDDPDEGPAVHFLWALVVVQALAVAAAAFLPFGFDKRSSLGLDFEHFLLLAGAYVLACLVGCGLAAALRQWKMLLAQLGGAILVLLLLFLISAELVGDEQQRPASHSELTEDTPAVDGDPPFDREETERAIRDAERELANPPK